MKRSQYLIPFLVGSLALATAAFNPATAEPYGSAGGPQRTDRVQYADAASPSYGQSGGYGHGGGQGYYRSYSSGNGNQYGGYGRGGGYGYGYGGYDDDDDDDGDDYYFGSELCYFAVPITAYNRYVQIFGNDNFKGRKFRRFIRRNGIALSNPIDHYWQTHRDYGRYGYWSPQWVYVEMPSGKLWF